MFVNPNERPLTYRACLRQLYLMARYDPNWYLLRALLMLSCAAFAILVGGLDLLLVVPTVLISDVLGIFVVVYLFYRLMLHCGQTTIPTYFEDYRRG